jgi:hypothetical protein
LNPKEFLQYCREEIAAGGNWRYRIYKSTFYHDLSARFDNVDSVVDLAERQMADRPVVQELRAAVKAVTENPLDFYGEKATAHRVAELVEFRMTVGGYKRTVERAHSDLGRCRLHEMIMTELTELGRVPIELEE